MTYNHYPIKLRPVERLAYCRGCDAAMPAKTEVVATFSFRNKGQHIYFCKACAALIGQLVAANQ